MIKGALTGRRRAEVAPLAGDEPVAEHPVPARAPVPPRPVRRDDVAARRVRRAPAAVGGVVRGRVAPPVEPPPQLRDAELHGRDPPRRVRGHAAVSASSHPAASTLPHRMNWPSPRAAAALPGSGGAEATHVQAAVPLPPPHPGLRSSFAMTSDGTVQLEAAAGAPPQPRTKIPVREETPYPAPLSDARVSETVRSQEGATATTKVEALGSKDRIGYGAAAAPRGSSAAPAVWLKARMMGQSP
jgi:hypothetical protein